MQDCNAKMKDYSWLNRKRLLSIDNLRLWDGNPRLNPEEKRVSTMDFAEELLDVDTEKSSFMELVKSIAKSYIPADPIVVWKNEHNNKYYVAEGNRRILSLKLLREPNKAPKSIRGVIRSLSKDWSPFDKIYVCVAPTFEDAEWYINQRNSTATLQRPWSRLQQQRWILMLFKKYNSNIDIVVDKTSLPKGEIESFIRITQFVDWIKLNEVKSVLSESEFEKATSHRFPVTIIERFFSNSVVKESWGVDFEGVKIILKNRSDFMKAYAALIKNIVTDKPDIQIDTRTITSDLDNILNRLPKVDLSNIDEKDINQNPNNNTENIDNDNISSKDEIANNRNNQQRTINHNEFDAHKRNRVIPSNVFINTSNNRMYDIFVELGKLPVGSYKNAASASLRIFLDLSVLNFIETENLESECCEKYKGGRLRDITLSKRLEFLSQCSKLKAKGVQIIRKLLNPNNEFSLDVLNGYQHSNDTWSLDKAFINRFWDFMFPLFQELLDIKIDNLTE